MDHTLLDPTLLQALCDQIDVAMMVLDTKSGIILFLNSQVPDTLGGTKHDYQGKNFREVFSTEFTRHYIRAVDACPPGQSHKSVYYWKERSLWEQISLRRVRTKGGRSIVILSITNITEVSLAEYHNRRLAYFDPVLGLPNSYMLEKDVSALSSPETVALLYFQLERFEDISDLFGVEVSDALLRQVRDWLLGSESRSASLYRVGDGFVILGGRVTLEDAKDRGREILRRFERPWSVTVAGQPYEMYRTVKLGIVCGKYVHNEMRNLLMRTLRAPATRHGYVLYDERIDEAAQRSLGLRQALVNSIQRDMAGFSVRYHPIVQAGSHRWVGVEALCRWNTPWGVPVPPIDFIHIAEQLGLIGRVDGWVRETAMRQCMELELGEKDFYLDVNFSPTQTVDEAFVEGLMASLQRTGFPSPKLNMEITESAKMQFTEENLRGLEALAGRGVILSLDDFGTGYSTFENLFRLPAVALKTEKLFIDELEVNTYRQYLMKQLIDLAHHLGMLIIAEGVETKAQCELLEGLGADFFSGVFV